MANRPNRAVPAIIQIFRDYTSFSPIVYTVCGKISTAAGS
jgi:hypothetical protein